MSDTRSWDELHRDMEEGDLDAGIAGLQKTLDAQKGIASDTNGKNNLQKKVGSSKKTETKKSRKPNE